MKGMVADAKTGQVQLVDDGLPQTPMTPWVAPEGLDLAKARQDLATLTQKVTDLEAVK